jgi:heme A synthase
MVYNAAKAFYFKESIMSKILRAFLTGVILAAAVVLLGGCVSTVKKMAVDSLLYQVKNEKPLTQADMSALATMIETRSLAGGLGAARTIYVVGKTATGLVRQYAGLAALMGIDVNDWTVPELLSLLDEAGLIKKGDYDYLSGIDPKIFDPTETEAEMIDANKNTLLAALAQLAAAYGGFGL